MGVPLLSDLCVGFIPNWFHLCVPGGVESRATNLQHDLQSPLPIRSVAMVDCTIVGLGWGLGWGLGGTRSR